MVGFAIFIAWIFCAQPQRWRWREPFLVVIVIVLSLLTYARNRVWQTPFTLWQDVIEKSPRKPRGYDNLASAYLSQHNYAQAEEYIQRVFVLGPSAANWKTYNNRGLIYLDTGRYEEAIKQFKIALMGYPESALIMCNMGVAFLRQGQLDKAKVLFKEAVRREPQLVSLWLNLGSIAKQRADFIGAAHFYEEALHQDPREVQAMFALAELYLWLGDNDRAIEYAKQMLTESQDPVQLTLLGSIFADKNSRNMGRSLLEKAIALDPRWIMAYLELGKVYGNADHFDEAIAIWQKGEQLAPADQRFPELIRAAQVLKGR
jgi:tetratricopeptide (TPR) repeat protein